MPQGEHVNWWDRSAAPNEPPMVFNVESFQRDRVPNETMDGLRGRGLVPIGAYEQFEDSVVGYFENLPDPASVGPGMRIILRRNIPNFNTTASVSMSLNSVQATIVGVVEIAPERFYVSPPPREYYDEPASVHAMETRTRHKFTLTVQLNERPVEFVNWPPVTPVHAEPGQPKLMLVDKIIEELYPAWQDCEICGVLKHIPLIGPDSGDVVSLLCDGKRTTKLKLNSFSEKDGVFFIYCTPVEIYRRNHLERPPASFDHSSLMAAMMAAANPAGRPHLESLADLLSTVPPVWNHPATFPSADIEEPHDGEEGAEEELGPL